MKVHELLSKNRAIISALARAGVSPSRLWTLDLFGEYSRLLESGKQPTVIVAELSDRYKMTERTVWGIIRQMKEDVTV